MITKLVPRIRSTVDSKDKEPAQHNIPIAIVDKMAKIRPMYLKTNGDKHRSAHGTIKALAKKGGIGGTENTVLFRKHFH